MVQRGHPTRLRAKQSRFTAIKRNGKKLTFDRQYRPKQEVIDVIKSHEKYDKESNTQLVPLVWMVGK